MPRHPETSASGNTGAVREPANNIAVTTAEEARANLREMLARLNPVARAFRPTLYVHPATCAVLGVEIDSEGHGEFEGYPIIALGCDCGDTPETHEATVVTGRCRSESRVSVSVPRRGLHRR